MELRNHTPFVVTTFGSLDLQDQPFQIVVLRATFIIIHNSSLKPSPKQMPLIETDCYQGEPAQTNLIEESDFIPFKPSSDIIVRANAYAPGGIPCKEWLVRVRVGTLSKRLKITGERAWKYFPNTGWQLDHPQPVAEVPIQYNLAFGGQIECSQDIKLFEENPLGLGFVDYNGLDKTSSIKAPQITDPDYPVTTLGRTYTPQGLGPIPKFWLPRRNYAGTYDEQWLKTRHPYLPSNFDYSYYNCAHPDLIYEGYLQGDEIVTLENLHHDYPVLQFRLPGYNMGVLLRYKNGDINACTANLDTLYIDTLSNQVFLTWRSAFYLSNPLRVLETRMTQGSK